MIFVDASYYLSLLLNDSNYSSALRISRSLNATDCVTSQAVLGEVLTVGSMRFNRQAAITLVQQIIDSGTTIILESSEIVVLAREIFVKVRSKNVGWVDCYSLAIMQHMSIPNLVSFDRELNNLAVNIRKGG